MLELRPMHVVRIIIYYFFFIIYCNLMDDNWSILLYFRIQYVMYIIMANLNFLIILIIHVHMVNFRGRFNLTKIKKTVHTYSFADKIFT